MNGLKKLFSLTSNEAQTNLKCFQWPKDAFCSLNKSEKWFKIVKKLRLTPYSFLGAFFQSQFSRELYIQSSSNQANKRFSRPKEAFLILLKKSQKWSKIVKKLRLTPLLFGTFLNVNFCDNFTMFGPFLMFWKKAT